MSVAASNRRPVLQAIFRVGASTLLIVLLVRLAMRGDLWGVLDRLAATDILLLLLGFAAIHTTGVLKWRMLVRVGGTRLPLLYAVRCYATGLFGNIFMPSNIGGDVISTGMAMRHASNKASVVAGTLVGRALDLCALMTVLAIGTLLVGTSTIGRLGMHVSAAAARIAIIVAIAAAAGVVAAGAVIVTRRSHFIARLPMRFRRLLVKIRGVWRSMRANPGAVVLAYCVSLVLQTGLLSLNMWAGVLCGLDVPYPVWLFAWPLAKLVAFIPISQGGFGTREFAFAGLLAPFGASSTLVITVGLVWDVLLVIAGLSGGTLALLLARVAPPESVQISRFEAERSTT